jgi:protein-S-isoprenylcysteine O-methyltransferase Ste14
LGELLILIVHAPWYLALSAFVMGLLMVSFLVFAATKETDYLARCLGEGFMRYKEQVHPFLPLKKYS